MAILDFIPIIGKVLDSIFPDPVAAADAKVKLIELTQRGELAYLDADVKLATGQMEINTAEAGSASIFVSGWRPFIGWICGSAMAYKFILAPVLLFAFTAFGHPLTLPALDFTEMNTVLLGMLGIGAMRTYEKVKGVAS